MLWWNSGKEDQRWPSSCVWALEPGFHLFVGSCGFLVLLSVFLFFCFRLVSQSYCLGNSSFLFNFFNFSTSLYLVVFLGVLCFYKRLVVLYFFFLTCNCFIFCQSLHLKAAFWVYSGLPNLASGWTSCLLNSCFMTATAAKDWFTPLETASVQAAHTSQNQLDGDWVTLLSSNKT